MHLNIKAVALFGLALLPEIVSSLAVRATLAATPQNVTLIHRWATNGTKYGIAVISKDGKLVGSDCDNKLDTGIWAKYPIGLKFGSLTTSKGNITVNGTVYPITSKVVAGKPSCYRAHNKKMLELICNVPISSKIVLATVTESCAPCFDKSMTSFDIALGHTFMLPRFKMPGTKAKRWTVDERHAVRSDNKLALVARELENRQTCVATEVTLLVGDGNPHQNYFHQQVTETNDCKSATQCSAEKTTGTAISFGFSAGITVEEWISGGFSVEKTFSTDESYQCTGSTGDSVCVWYNAAHTAYTVGNYDQLCCGGSCSSKSDGQGVLTSPNKNNGGGNYYCVIGTCRGKGDSYWDYDGPAGGPPS